MPNTYTELRRTVVGTATSSVTLDLTGISGYTDLIVVMSPISSSGQRQVYMEINGDTGANYSRTILSGTGSAAVSARNSNQNQTYLDYYGVVETVPTNKIIQFMNYSNTTTFKTILTRSNDTSLGLDAIVHLWRSTAAITQIKFYIDAVNFAVGSTFSLYGIANADLGAAKATGGIITEDSQYWYHTFGASGAFVPKQSLTCDVLVVAGGGGGGGVGSVSGSISGAAGGGGAGGLRALTSQSLIATSYAITIGAGASGGAAGFNRGANGSNTTFDATTSAGGGGGGSNYNGGGTNAGMSGNDGGSGGGGGGSGRGADTGTGGAASPSGQGNIGGTTGGNRGASGGGGSATAGGSAVSDNFADPGGNGLDTYSSWSLVTSTGVSGRYAAGGGGGGWDGADFGAGGLGGGGNGGANANNGGNAIANTGSGGGGGGARNDSTTIGGNGGSGVVIVRYAK